MCLLWIEVSVKYHKIRFCKYYMKCKRSSEEGSLKVQHGRTKCKSATETAAPWNIFFVAKNTFVKNVTEQPQKLHIAGEYHTRFQSPNVQQVESLTE